MDSGIESTIFRLCILSSMFVEYHALPTRPGKTEIKMLHLAFAIRTSVFFDVFQTFIQHVWKAPEKFFVSQSDFINQMSEYPLNRFLETSTFRKMIALRMPDSAACIVKNRDKMVQSVADSSNVYQLESRSRPDLHKYSFKPSIYEKSERSLNMSLCYQQNNKD